MAAFKIQVLSTSGIKFSLPWHYIGKKTAEDSAEIFEYCVGNGFVSIDLAFLSRAMIWFFNI